MSFNATVQKLKNSLILVGVLSTMMTSVAFSQMAVGKGKYLGNIWGTFGSPPLNFDLYWNQITPENNGKWEFVEGTRNSYSWTRLDQIYDYAIAKGYPFRFHTLVWGQQYPAWISALDSASQYQEVEEWIRLVGERYPSTSFVDVVNEPLHAPPPYRNALGGNGATGWDWVIKAFELARQYMLRGVKLHLNDYGIINNTQATQNYLTIINLLKARNLIDGIGVQGHRFELESADTNTIKSNLDAIAATGLPIYITEMDVAPGNQLNDTTQLAEMQRIFPVLWRHPGIKGITFWGYLQGQTWQQNAYLVTSTGAERPALQWLKSFMASIPSRVGGQQEIPTEFFLAQNYPNPFNPTTAIRYSLPVAADVNLTIYNLLGEKIRTLVDVHQQAGDFSVTWDGVSDHGTTVPSGVYVYRLSAGKNARQRKMILIR